MKIEELYQLYSKNYLVDTDTRNIRQNTIFFALKGANFNGNKFAKDALDKGAIYAVVDEEEFVTDDRIILVTNVLTVLQHLATYHRQQLNIPIIALTGSNGKTTTKELINAVMSQQYKTTATLGNLNNHIGVPLTLLSMTPETEIGIVEMGANHHKEIALLSNIAKPNYGYITNFGKAHLEGFGSVEGVIEAKSELYDFLKTNEQTIFVNTEDKIQVERTKDANCIFLEPSIVFKEVNPFVKLSFKEEEIQSNLIGSYNYNNIAAAITIGNHFKVAKKAIKTAIENYIPSNNRSQIIQKGQIKIILDAYNANPTSMRAALENFNLLKAKRKIVVLGDMFELGETVAKEHQEIAEISENINVDTVYLIGENFNKTITKKAVKYTTYAEFEAKVNTEKMKEALLLIKGSRGMALERLVALF